MRTQLTAHLPCRLLEELSVQEDIVPNTIDLYGNPYEPGPFTSPCGTVFRNLMPYDLAGMEHFHLVEIYDAIIAPELIGQIITVAVGSAGGVEPQLDNNS